MVQPKDSSATILCRLLQGLCFLSRQEGFSSLLHFLPCSPPDLHVDFHVL